MGCGAIGRVDIDEGASGVVVGERGVEKDATEADNTARFGLGEWV